MQIFLKAYILLLILLVTIDGKKQRVRKIFTSQKVFGSRETIQVQFRNLSDKQQNWISIAQENKDADYREQGKWAFTQGKTSGVMEFTPAIMGKYEARLYYDFPKGGYIIQQRYQFRVDACVAGCTSCYHDLCEVPSYGYYLDDQDIPRHCHYSCGDCRGKGRYNCTLCAKGFDFSEKGTCYEQNKGDRVEIPQQKKQLCPYVYSQCQFTGKTLNLCQQNTQISFLPQSIVIPTTNKKPIQIYKKNFNLQENSQKGYAEFSRTIHCINWKEY